MKRDLRALATRGNTYAPEEPKVLVRGEQVMEQA